MAALKSFDYEDVYRRFRYVIPPTFNFGRDVVDQWAEDPEKLALLWSDASGLSKRLSFDDVKRASNRLANMLVGQGLRPGDRVIVQLPRLPEWQIVLTACLKVGAVPIPCITMLTAKDVAYRVHHSGARAAITLSEETSKFRRARRRRHQGCHRCAGRRLAVRTMSATVSRTRSQPMTRRRTHRRSCITPPGRPGTPRVCVTLRGHFMSGRFPPSTG